jgi:hypothetical protein
LYSAHKSTPVIPIPRQINLYHLMLLRFSQRWNVAAWLTLRPWRWKQYFPPKCQWFYRTSRSNIPEDNNRNCNIIFPPTPRSPKLSSDFLNFYVKIWYQNIELSSESVQVMQLNQFILRDVMTIVCFLMDKICSAVVSHPTFTSPSYYMYSNWSYVKTYYATAGLCEHIPTISRPHNHRLILSI